MLLVPFPGLLLAAARTALGGWKWSSLPPAWILTLAAIVLFLFFRVLYRHERGRAGRTTRLLLAGVRAAVLFLLLLVLGGPYREEIQTSEERSHLVVLVDTSASMDTKDRYPSEEIERLRAVAWPDGAPVSDEDVLDTSRLDLVRRVLGADGEAVLRALDERFALHVFAFDVDWRGLGSTGEEPAGEAAEGDEGPDAPARIGQAIRDLQPTGQGTDLGGVLSRVAAEFLGREDRRLAGVLLVTDGRHTAGGEGPLDALAGLGVARRDLHVTAVALGNASSGRNLRVERIRAMDWVLVEDDVVFETAIRHVGFTGQADVRAEMTIEKVADAEGRTLEKPVPYEPPAGAIAEQGPFRLGTEDEPTPVRMRARMREPGTFRVSVRAVLPREDAGMDSIPEDDVATHELRVVDQRIKVLYVDNLPRYDLRFLGNWLTREPEPDPTRPEQRGRYDAQILQQSADPTLDPPHSPTTEPLRAFPRTRRDLFAYDVLILGDIDWLHLAGTPQESRALLGLIRDFVEEGGGVVLEAGEDYNDPLSFRDTPLQDLVPVVLRDRDRTVSDKDRKDKPFRIELTDAGRLHPVFGVVPGSDGGIASPEELLQIWRGDDPPPFARFARDWMWYWMYRATGGLKPGAIALARAWQSGPLDPDLLDDTGRPVVVFAVMPYGRGRVFFSALDSIWRIRKAQGDRFYGAFWDQVIRYLATYRLLGGNKRYKITTDKERYFAGEVATVTITALDRDYEPLADPWLDGLHIEGPDGVSVRLEGDERPENMAAEGAAPGTYRLYRPLRRKGTYRLWIRDPDDTGRGVGNRAERRIEVEYRAQELRLTLPDHDLLAAIVEETDGRFVDDRLARLSDLPALAQDLPARTAQRIVDRRERTQWDAPWVLLLLVALLGLEWALRKRWQML